mmetsp:Transcript_9211/g.20053  ORF Transcript_9211/g.20053 Transcript_9211/m.20053 type:complete len:226 (-) Transcript_9211:79-756(-)
MKAHIDHTVAANKREPNMCCMCVPLRLGVFFTALLSIFLSLLTIVGKSQFGDYLRIFGGGYTLYSRVVIYIICLTGALWSVLGAMGAWKNQEGLVTIYWRYQQLRLVGWVFAFCCDIPALMRCNNWILDINKEIAHSGWNPIVYQIALEGRCESEFALFAVCSSLMFWLYVYFTTKTGEYVAYLSSEVPRFIYKDRPTLHPAFYTRSMGEAAYAAQEAGHDKTLV